jgi:hypothetical protein
MLNGREGEGGGGGGGRVRGKKEEGWRGKKGMNVFGSSFFTT